MSTASWLATVLDREMLEVVRSPSVSIASPITPDGRLPPKNGRDVWHELGGRYLLRYVLPHQVGLYTHGSSHQHYATPTPYAPEETISWLALPAPRQPRPFVLLIDPSRLGERPILGPRWVRLGKAIEYTLPQGFPKDALAFPWEVEVT